MPGDTGFACRRPESNPSRQSRRRPPGRGSASEPWVCLAGLPFSTANWQGKPSAGRIRYRVPQVHHLELPLVSVPVNRRISPCYEWNNNWHRSPSANDCASCGTPAGGHRKRPQKLAASDISSISSTSSGSKETPVWPRSKRSPGASGWGFTNCSPRLPGPALAPANRLPPQRPGPNPGNGRPGENVRENYRAVVAMPAGSSAMRVWAPNDHRR